MICPLRKGTGKLHLGLGPAAEARLAAAASRDAAGWGRVPRVTRDEGVAQRHVGRTRHGDLAIEMLPHQDAEAGARVAAGAAAAA